MKKKHVLLYCVLNVLAIVILMGVVSFVPSKIAEKHLVDVFD